MVLELTHKEELTIEMLKNKLFCTFAKKDNIDETIYDICSEYKILYDKVFVLASPESDELMCTYNIELTEGDESPRILKNTILVHRKKEFNTLYTINSLNALITKLNNGVLDTHFPINWPDYSNCILLVQDGQFKKLNTVIHKIVKQSVYLQD